MQEIQKVFTDWKYITLGTISSLLVFVFAVWFPNLKLLFGIWSNSSISITSKITFGLNLLQSISTNFTILSATYTIGIALLVGINMSLTLYLIKRQRQYSLKGGVATSMLGLLSGMFGLGCAACGSLVVTSILSAIGGVGILAVLPLKGGEFGIIGFMLLAYSTYLLLKRITSPVVCKI